jgi:RNAse (barnase) inhibitor barstar
MAAHASLASHLQSIKPPWVSLLVVKPGERVDSLLSLPKGFVLKVLNGDKCASAAGLFAEFARVLDFPDYFGHNWDAFEECLADLEWLPARGYVLLLSQAEQVLREDEDGYETFLEVLSDAGEAWGSGQAGMGSQPPTPFHVLFAVSPHGKTARDHWGVTELIVNQSREPAARRRATSRKPSRR